MDIGYVLNSYEFHVYNKQSYEHFLIKLLNTQIDKTERNISDIIKRSV